MILTVCTGNICRSPIAENFLAGELPERRVESAGLHAVLDHDIDEEAKAAAKKLGIDIRPHRARQINTELLLKAKIILVMEAHQRYEIASRWPFALGKTFLLGHMNGGQEIPDPFRMGELAHTTSAALILENSKLWIKFLKEI